MTKKQLAAAAGISRSRIEQLMKLYSAKPPAALYS